MTARYALLYADKIEKFCIYFLHSWILGLPDRRDSATRIPGIILFGARALRAARRVYRTIRHSSMQGFRSPVRVEVVKWKAATRSLCARV